MLAESMNGPHEPCSEDLGSQDPVLGLGREESFLDSQGPGQLCCFDSQIPMSLSWSQLPQCYSGYVSLFPVLWKSTPCPFSRHVAKVRQVTQGRFQSLIAELLQSMGKMRDSVLTPLVELLDIPTPANNFPVSVYRN